MIEANRIDFAALDDALAARRRNSRLLAVVAAFGILAVIASLATLYVLAVQRAELAERNELAARENAQAMSDQLEKVRWAFAEGDMDLVSERLGVALVKAEGVTIAPTRAVAAEDVGLSDAQLRRIVERTPAYSVSDKAGAFGQQVYIQFGGALSRAQIAALNRALREAGWKARGDSGERLETARGLNEVRYSGGDRAAAEALAAAINEARMTSGPVRAREVDAIRPGVLEAWISAEQGRTAWPAQASPAPAD